MPNITLQTYRIVNDEMFAAFAKSASEIFQFQGIEYTDVAETPVSRYASAGEVVTEQNDARLRTIVTVVLAQRNDADLFRILGKELTQAAVQTLKAPIEEVEVRIEELKPRHYFVAGKSFKAPAKSSSREP